MSCCDDQNQGELVVREFKGELNKHNEKIDDTDAWPVARFGRGLRFLRGRCSEERREEEEQEEED